MIYRAGFSLAWELLMETIQTNVFGVPSFTAGSTLGRTWTTLFKNQAVFFGLPLTAALPPALVSALMPESGRLNAVMMLLGLVLGLAVQGAIAYAVFQTLRDERVVSPGAAISHGMRRLFPLILAALLVAVLTQLALFFFVIPGLVVSCVLAVTIQACVVERLGPLKSMGRSAELTRGHRWTVFGLVLIVGVILYGCAFVEIFWFPKMFGRMWGPLAGVLLTLLPQAFNYVMLAIIYADLRAVKEGITIDTLANVFD